MVYECDKCSAPLPASVVTCPKCGEQFDEAVPADAEIPKRGFSAVSEAPSRIPNRPRQSQNALEPSTFATFSTTASGPQSKAPSPWHKNLGPFGIIAVAVLVIIGIVVLVSVTNPGTSTAPTTAITTTSASAVTIPTASNSDNPSADNASPDNSAPSSLNDAPPLTKGSEHFSKESDFDIVAGEIMNVGDVKLDDVEAVTTFYDSDGNVVKTSDALIDFNPLMPGQTSSYKTMEPDNPSIKTEKTEFHTMGGPLIPYTLKGASRSAGNSDASSDPNRDPVSEVAASGSGLSDQPLKRNVLENTAVTKDDLTGKSLSALSISYNTIYAVHGYVFQRRSLQQVFDKMPWYHSNPAFSESDLNQLERDNLKTIRDYERKVYHY